MTPLTAAPLVEHRVTVHLTQDFFAANEWEKDAAVGEMIDEAERLVAGSPWRVGVVGVDTTGREKT